MIISLFLIIKKLILCGCKENLHSDRPAGAERVNLDNVILKGATFTETR